MVCKYDLWFANMLEKELQSDVSETSTSRVQDVWGYVQGLSVCVYCSLSCIFQWWYTHRTPLKFNVQRWLCGSHYRDEELQQTEKLILTKHRREQRSGARGQHLLHGRDGRHGAAAAGPLPHPAHLSDRERKNTSRHLAMGTACTSVRCSLVPGQAVSTGSSLVPCYVKQVTLQVSATQSPSLWSDLVSLVKSLCDSGSREPHSWWQSIIRRALSLVNAVHRQINPLIH